MYKTNRDLDNEISGVTGDLGDLESRVSTNESDITALESRVTTNEGDITTINGDIVTINNTLANGAIDTVGSVVDGTYYERLQFSAYVKYDAALLGPPDNMYHSTALNSSSGSILPHGQSLYLNGLDLGWNPRCYRVDAASAAGSDVYTWPDGVVSKCKMVTTCYGTDPSYSTGSERFFYWFVSQEFTAMKKVGYPLRVSGYYQHVPEVVAGNDSDTSYLDPAHFNDAAASCGQPFRAFWNITDSSPYIPTIRLYDSTDLSGTDINACDSLAIKLYGYDDGVSSWGARDPDMQYLIMTTVDVQHIPINTLSFPA